MTSPLRPPLALIATLILGACSRQTADEFHAALHLDPRASHSKKSAAEVLDEARHVVLSTPTLSSAGSIAPWVFTGAKPKSGPAGGTLVSSTPVSPAIFTLAFEPGQAPDFDTLELDVQLAGECTAEVQLTFADGTHERHRSWIPFRPSRAPLELFLGPRTPDRTLTEIRFAPSLDKPRIFEIFQLDLAWRGLGVPVDAPVAGDSGLVELAGLRRRVWPLLANHDLTVQLELPEEAHLWARAWAPTPGTTDFDAFCSLAVFGAPGTIDTQMVAVPKTALANEDRQAFTFEMDLSTFAGRKVELTFHGKGQAGQLSALLESPMLVPGPRVHERRPDVVLVTLDTTRADFANDANLAPQLAELGRAGLVFTNAWSPSNTTTPAHASILTGLAPHQHGAIAVGKYRLPASVTTLAERLRAAGYRTGAFTSVEHIDAAHGFGQGFDVFLDGSQEGSRDGRFALAAARSFIDEVAPSGAPMFLWLHLFDAHTPYELPSDVAQFPSSTLPTDALPAELPSWARRQNQLRWLPQDESAAALRRHYAQGVSFVDQLVGQLCQDLKARGRFQETLIAVTADHGEGLGERGVFASHVSLLPPVLHIPLVLKLPASSLAKSPPPGTRIAAPISSQDIYGTVLEVLGLERPAGPTLLAPDQERILWFESDRLTQVGRLGAGQLAIGTLRETDLHNGPEDRPLLPGHQEAFDLTAKAPLSVELVAAGTPPSELETWLDEASERVLGGTNGERLKQALTPDELARLRALGYLGDE